MENNEKYTMPIALPKPDPMPIKASTEFKNEVANKGTLKEIKDNLAAQEAVEAHAKLAFDIQDLKIAVAGAFKSKHTSFDESIEKTPVSVVQDRNSGKYFVTTYCERKLKITDSKLKTFLLSEVVNKTPAEVFLNEATSVLLTKGMGVKGSKRPDALDLLLPEGLPVRVKVTADIVTGENGPQLKNEVVELFADFQFNFNKKNNNELFIKVRTSNRYSVLKTVDRKTSASEIAQFFADNTWFEKALNIKKKTNTNNNKSIEVNELINVKESGN